LQQILILDYSIPSSLRFLVRCSAAVLYFQSFRFRATTPQTTSQTPRNTEYTFSMAHESFTFKTQRQTFILNKHLYFTTSKAIIFKINRISDLSFPIMHNIPAIKAQKNAIMHSI
jgi:hypothetical protein